MKIGTVVRNEYQGIIRYGKVSAIFKGDDSWTWCEVDWVDDEKYQQAIEARNNITNLNHGRNFYRVDELQQFNLDQTIQTLMKLRQ